MNSNNVRNSNLELYRIIVMLLIIAHHYVVNSDLMIVMKEDPLSCRSIFFYIFGAWGKTGINCFVMITGYFMCKSQITARKFFKLLFEVLFYRIVIYSIFIFTGYENFSMATLVNLIPARNLNTNFTSCFLVFYLCIPFLNILIKNIDKRKHLQLIVLCLFIYTAHASIPLTSVSLNYISWFIVLYFIASYIRLYPSKYDTNLQFWLCCLFVCFIVAVVSIIGILWFNDIYNTTFGPYKLISDSNAIMALAIGVCSFMCFKNLNIRYNKLINVIGASVFGVFLIHTNSDTMRKWLWKDLLDNVGHYSDEFFWLRSIVYIILIFVVCVIIDYIMKKNIEKPLFDKIFN